MIIHTIKQLHQLSDAELTKVQAIHLHHYEEKDLQIPDRIYDCINITSLRLLQRKQCKLTPSIARLQKLESLQIDNCPIQALPKEIGQLIELKIFKCEETTLETIPIALFNCTKLVELSFRKSRIKTIPKEIKQLKQLKKLAAHHSTLESLPKELTELPNLEELTLYGTPIQTLPEWIGQLKNIKQLGVPTTHYKQVPYFLFQLKKLAYFCIPAFTVENIPVAVTEQLQKYLKRHVSPFVAQAYIELSLGSSQEKTKIPLKYFVELSNTNDKTIVQKLIVHLKKYCAHTLIEKPFETGSQLTILGKFDGLGMDYIKELFENKGIEVQTKTTKTTTHLVLCYENKRKFDPSKFPDLVLLDNKSLIDWVKTNEGAGYLEDSAEQEIPLLQENLHALLLSNSFENIQTGLEMLKSGGISKATILPLLIAYSDIANHTTEEKNIRNEIRKALYQSSVLSESTKNRVRRDLSKGGFSFNPRQDRTEQAYKKRLERKGCKEFDMTGMAKHYFKTKRRAYLYLFNSNQVEHQDKYQFVKDNFLEGSSLNLSGLEQLNKLPLILTEFKSIEYINLESCAFAIFPSMLRDGAFPGLKRINLRKNPIQKLSKAVLKKLSSCEILIDS